MIISSQILFILSVLAPFITASRPDISVSSTSIGTNGFADDTARQFAKIRLDNDNFENILAKGAMLWVKTLQNDMEATVILLNDEIGKITESSTDFSSAAALLHGFLEASGSAFDQTVDSIVKTALASHALDLLQTLTVLYVWSSPEQFHWFQALSYKSKWHSSMAWKNNLIHMDWNKNLHVIYMVDNSALLNDIISGAVLGSRLVSNDNAMFNLVPNDNARFNLTPGENAMSNLIPNDNAMFNLVPNDNARFNLTPGENAMSNLIPNDNAMLNLIAEHDSLKIYQSLNPTPHNHLKILAESGAFKILRYLHEAKAIELHLENYPPPKKLPESIADFKFFWMQGYRYSSVSHFLKKSCEYGRVDIIKLIHQLEPTILKPNELHLTLAAANGHFNVLEWALDENLPMDCTAVVSKIVLNGHFKVFEQLEKRLNLIAKDIQHISNIAAGQDRFNVVRWLYNKYKVLPRSHTLGAASIEMLEWVESINPQSINKELASNSSLDNLKWLSKNHPRTITRHVRHLHSYLATNFEKIQWMVPRGWAVIPDLSLAASKNEIETLRFGYSVLQMKPAKEHANMAAQNGHGKILELICSIDPSCFDKNMLSIAVKNNHLDAAKYLESILKLKGTWVDIDLTMAFSSGNLELVEWTHQHYEFFLQKSKYIEKAVENGHLHIINWAMKARSMWGNWVDHLLNAAQWGHYPIFQSLVDHGIALNDFSERCAVQLAFNSGCLEIIRYFVEKKSRVKVVKCLRDEKVNVNNYHIWLWLRDQNPREECCIL